MFASLFGRAVTEDQTQYLRLVEQVFEAEIDGSDSHEQVASASRLGYALALPDGTPAIWDTSVPTRQLLSTGLRATLRPGKRLTEKAVRIHT